ncbi:MAG: translation initiation factor IF-2 [Flavobacteriales bacterium]|nr:translation initiation factor IF-2 [Flavobacteriales bacterium]|tara:strand:+ start:1307 stop:4036 length:2730 start_codon:yes stop_codon:yes gene_type:complete
MAGKPKRLSKVTKEFNLGLSTVVDFLQEKGFEVESNPNAKISPEMYDVLSGEFQTEKKVKEKSKNIEVKKPIKETISIEEEKPKAEVSKETDKASENETPQVEVDSVSESQISDSVKTEVSKEKTELKVLGKIELKEDKKGKSFKSSKEDVSKKQASKSDQPKQNSEAEAETQKAGSDNQTESDSKDSPQDDFIKVKTAKIDGPKVLGKIELPVEKSKKKPVASSNDGDKNKKKRKRIRKGPVAPDQNLQSGRGGNRGGKGRDGRKSREPKVELTDEQVKKQIQETLARLSGGKKKNQSAKQRRTKRDEHARRAAEQEAQAELEKSILRVTEYVAASELANLMDVSVNDIISACMSLGHFVSINQRLDAEIIQMVAEEFGFEVEFASAEDTTTVVEEEDAPENLKERAPIVTVMGHVDHGKTSLLDNIRKASVAEGEAGGITQHIGAYSVKVETGQRITFLDTPGHEAFTAMRARGAKVTDIAIIIIAADDSIMPQTREAINHAQAAEVPMVFAINKIDKAGANPDKIKEELSQMNILVEDWGGKYQCQEISAKQGVGIDELLEKVLLEAELMELKANPDRLAKGTIIESELDKGRGYVSTLLVQSGTLEIGSILVAGCYSGRVKAMTNEHGNRVTVAGPSTPVQLLGLNGAPQAGDVFNAMEEEKEARDIASRRMQLQREQGIRATKHITLEEMGRRIAIGDFQELNVIVKGDVDGSIEALSDALLKLSTEQIQINIIHKSVGQISDTDVLLATASDAIIVGFQVRPSASARKLAEQEQIDIRLYSIIYKAIEELKDAMEGMLKPKIEEKVVANVEVRETFKISKVGTVAGCYVLDGTISRSSKIRIIRDGIVAWTGELAALKRFKDDVKEVKFGYECGLSLLNYNDIQIGDVLEAYEEVEVKQTLKS